MRISFGSLPLSSLKRALNTVFFRGTILWQVLRTDRAYVLRWLLSLQPNYLLNTPAPWTTFSAIDFLRVRIRSGSRVFEYGSGGSTLFFARLGAECVSVEHDPEWYILLKPWIDKLPGRKVDHRLVVPEKGSASRCDPADPLGYCSADERYVGMTFQNYVQQIDSFPDAYFDLVFVDGRARTSCIAHAVPKIKPGGVLVLDNSDRDYYITNNIDLLQQFRQQRFSGVVAAEYAFGECTAFFVDDWVGSRKVKVN